MGRYNKQKHTMLNIFKTEKEGPEDIKALRHEVVQFIKAQLQKWEGGEGSTIKGLQLFLAPKEEEQHLYESVIYADDPSRFKEEEVQRIADDYAIDLPSNWTLEILFVDDLPAEAVKAPDLPVALYASTKKQPVLTSQTTAYLKVLNGEAEQEVYNLTDKIGKLCIGRDRKVASPEGFMRLNEIAFPSESGHKSNGSISRQHAHVEWNPEAGAFFLYADAGGIPPRNKIKIQTADGGIVRLQSTQVGHQLAEGDQVMLGESALLLFRYGQSNQ